MKFWLPIESNVTKSGYGQQFFSPFLSIRLILSVPCLYGSFSLLCHIREFGKAN